jgi:hypothetical protein
MLQNGFQRQSVDIGNPSLKVMLAYVAGAIDGKKLLKLSVKELEEIGVDNQADRLRILDLIFHLNRNDQSFNPPSDTIEAPTVPKSNSPSGSIARPPYSEYYTPRVSAEFDGISSLKLESSIEFQKRDVLVRVVLTRWIMAALKEYPLVVNPMN